MKDVIKASVLFLSVLLIFSCEKKKDPEPNGLNSGNGDNLFKLTNGSHKSWIWGEFLINGNDANQYFPCREGSEIIFKNDLTFSIDTSCDRSGKYVYGKPYNLLSDTKMFFALDTYNIKEFTDKRIKLERPYTLVMTSNLGGEKEIETTMEVTFNVK